MKFVPLKKNLFVRGELWVIHFLSHYDWSLTWLMKYQNLRFSNHIQYDIAGILMARNALKVIALTDLTLNKKNLNRVKNLYEGRLSRRQKRLKDFSDLYPEFYQNYQYLLFQQVGLICALKQLQIDFEAAKMSSKVYNKLHDRLHHALKQ
ncbi:MAG: hypothetical protein Q9M50_10555 [Methylococcales bacterium]|nr:hypothetical protein [Methylococcales bacterium]